MIPPAPVSGIEPMQEEMALFAGPPATLPSFHVATRLSVRRLAHDTVEYVRATLAFNRCAPTDVRRYMIDIYGHFPDRRRVD
jgi:hypothetical protein